MNVLLATFRDYIRHGKDWIAISMVYLMGVYWGTYNVASVNSYYSEYVAGLDLMGAGVSTDAQAAIFVLTKSYVSFMILCFLIIACGIFFGFMTIVLVAIQGMYMGFWINWIGVSEGSLPWYMTGLVGLTELIQIIFVLSAGALGIRLGKIMMMTFYEVFSRKPVMFRESFLAWWHQTLRYSLLAMFILGCNALIKVGLVYLV